MKHFSVLPSKFLTVLNLDIIAIGPKKCVLLIEF